jgi:hypothetical protein
MNKKRLTAILISVALSAVLVLLASNYSTANGVTVLATLCTTSTADGQADVCTQYQFLSNGAEICSVAHNPCSVSSNLYPGAVLCSHAEQYHC